MIWTNEALAALAQEDRHTVWTHAKKGGHTDLIKRIEESGLPYGDPKGLKLDSFVGREMEIIIFSQAGRDAGVAATLNGHPALALIEPLLVAALGKAYTQQKGATEQAGYLVANMMENNGYIKTETKRKMPEGSVAKTAEFFKRKS